MMPLTMVNVGEPVTIKRIGGKEETRKFLESLGFTVGGTVTVVSDVQGSVIFRKVRKEEGNEDFKKCSLWSDSKSNQTDR